MNHEDQRKKNPSRWGRRLLLGLALFFVILSLLPYGFALNEEIRAPKGPYAKSTMTVISDVSLHTRVLEPQGRVRGQVLLIHGLGGSTYSFRHTMEALVQEGYLVVSVDLPGFGYSARIPDFDHSQKNRSRLLWTLLSTLEDSLDREPTPWILLGHSMGGGTAVAMAAMAPQRTEALVLVAGAVAEESRFRGSVLAYPPLKRGATVLLNRLLPGEERMKGILASAYGRSPTPEELRGYHAPLLLPGTAVALTDMVRTAKNVPMKELSLEALPVLGIWGEKDTWVPKEAGEELKEVFPNMELVILREAAHCPMETHPALFHEALMDFLEPKP